MPGADGLLHGGPAAQPSDALQFSPRGAVMGLPIGAGFVLHVAICAITAVIARLIERSAAHQAALDAAVRQEEARHGRRRRRRTGPADLTRWMTGRGPH